MATFAHQFFAEDCAKREAGVPSSCMHVSDVCNSIDGGCGNDPLSNSFFHGPCNSKDNQTYQCAHVGLELAGSALTTSLGSSAQVIWGVGLLCAGQASTTTATYAGQILVSGFFDIDLPMWVVMAITRSLALGPAVLIALYTSGFPGATSTMNEYLNVLQSIQLPFALIPMLHFTGSRRIMGDFVTTYAMKLVAWSLAFAIMVINVYLVFTGLPFESTQVNIMIVGLYMAINYIFIGFLAKDECNEFAEYLSNIKWSQLWSMKSKSKSAQGNKEPKAPCCSCSFGWLAAYNPKHQNPGTGTGRQKSDGCPDGSHSELTGTASYGSFADTEADASFSLNALPAA